jgi:hypothetical protein
MFLRDSQGVQAIAEFTQSLFGGDHHATPLVHFEKNRR